MTQPAPAAADAAKFVETAENALAEVNVEQQRASWVAENFITYDTQILSACEAARVEVVGEEVRPQ